MCQKITLKITNLLSTEVEEQMENSFVKLNVLALSYISFFQFPNEVTAGRGLSSQMLPLSTFMFIARDESFYANFTQPFLLLLHIEKFVDYVIHYCFDSP